MSKTGKVNFIQDGHLTEEGLAVYADALHFHRLNTLPVDIRQHVEQCSDCKKKIMFIDSVMSSEEGQSKAVVENENGVAGPDYPGRRRMLRIAAVIAPLVLLGGLAYFLLHLTHVPQTTTQTLPEVRDTIRTSKPLSTDTSGSQDINTRSKGSAPTREEKVSDGSNLEDNPAYKESALFESLIASNYRGENVEVFAPSENQTYTPKDSIYFKFNRDNKDRIDIKIYDNQGKKIYQINNITGNNCVLDRKLTYGIYYWKLEINNKLVRVGKLVIK